MLPPNISMVIIRDPDQETCFKRINTKLNQLRLTLPDIPPVQLEVGVQEPPKAGMAPKNAEPWRRR